MEKFIVGSRRFFGDMQNYNEHDNDILIFLNENEWPDFVTSSHFGTRKDKCDLFFQKKMPIQEYINDIYSGKTYEISRVCSFLIPEVANSLNFTVQDLSKIKELVDMLAGKRHGWYVIVYNSYVENNGFFLTEEQKQTAYKEYKEYRT